MANLEEENKKSTIDKAIGLSIDGVELYSPSVFNESIYYGELSEVKILNGGLDYDVMNPPELEVIDSVGTGKSASIYGNLKGKLKEVLVISPGIGYDRKPTLSLVGGNLKGSIKLDSNLIKTPITSYFFPNSVGVSNTTITFIENHNFENGEEIIYNPNNFPTVVGLVTNSSYFAGVVDSNTISLFKTSTDALNKVNSLTLSTVVGVNTGIQYFKTLNVKNIIDKIYVEDINSELFHKIVKISSRRYPNTTNDNGINIENDYIYAKNHNFKDKDLVIYNSTGSLISGLSTTTQYYVTVLDENSFKLSNAGTGDIPNDDNYLNKIFTPLNSIGSGVHNFKYPPIKILVSTVPGITSTTPPTLEPVVLGSFESIFIENYGVGYGISEVVNLKLNPDITIKNQKNGLNDFQSQAVFKPVILDGKIVDIIILNLGNDYGKDTEIVVEGKGKYAKLYPVIQNKKIIEVKILEQGVGYDSNTTLVYARRRGKDAKFIANIKKWTVNQYFKYKNLITSSDENGFIIPSRNIEDSIQVVNFHPSDRLRSIVKDDGVNSSPILGWAYDGNPILGPYIQNNNQIVNISSSYRINSITSSLTRNSKRPPFSNGYFIEDYVYDESKSDLDEFNGMFIKDRPEFPNGTYAYFVTFNSSGDLEYPYVIGPSFKNTPNKKNYDLNFNQNIDITQENYIRNTSELYLNSSKSNYKLLDNINESYKQDVIVKNVLASNIEFFNIIDPGINYKIGDSIAFSTENEQDIDLDATVSEINGKTILTFNVGITTYTNVEFKYQNKKVVGITTISHNIQNNDYIYIKSSTNNNLIGNQKVQVPNKTVILLSNLSSTGISTYIQVDDVVGFQVDDYIKIDNETARILEVIPSQSKFFINRIQNLGVHTSGISSVSILANRFEFEDDKINNRLTIANKHYFNPIYSVGIGTTGKTINNLETDEIYYVPPQSIRIQNHNYKTNQELIYNKNSNFNGILVSDTPTSSTYRLPDGQKVYAINLGKDILGITTVAYSTTSLTFRESSYSSNEIHSFNFIGTSITGTIELANVEVSTLQNHQLLKNDVIKLKGVEDTWENSVINFDFNKNYSVNVVNNSTFRFNVKKPSFIKYAEDNSLDVKYLDASKISYVTNSKNTSGGISDIKLEYSSNFYREIPSIEKIESINGNSAIIVPFSTKVGKIDTVERIKDGFDYPTDTTLQPKVGANVICNITNNKKVSRIKIENKGSNYNTAPKLKVIGNDEIILEAKLKNYSVKEVKIIKTPNNLSEPLDVIPINNSNGIDILDIYKISSTTNRILIDITQFPLIYSDYNEPVVNFPFKIGDLIFIENCRIKESNKINYNSTDQNDKFFKVVGINTALGRIDYEILNENYGTYDFTQGYGTVVNKDQLASFEMILETCDYISGENVVAYDSFGNIKFSGYVLEKDGWNRNKNEIRITKAVGKLEVNDILVGTTSELRGRIIFSNSFEVQAKLGYSRSKINYKNNYSDLNSDLKRLQDSNYYQDFSYSIKGKTQYEDWKEAVKSIVHPSGFKEFSDLKVLSKPLNGLRAKTSDATLNFNISIQKEESLFERKSFTIGYENQKINKSSTERIYFGSGRQEWPIAGYGMGSASGISLLPFILNKSNNVIELKLKSEFDGTYDSYSLGSRNVTFDSQNRDYLGISTVGLLVGDKIGYSSYHEFPYDTKIVSIGINNIRTLYPHKVYSGISTQSLEIRRNVNQNTIVGISSFKLLSKDNKEIYSLHRNTSGINTNNNRIIGPHIFETGQLIKYENIGGTKIGIQTTNQVIGGISTDKLPSSLYVIKVTNNSFQVSGLSTTGRLDLTTTGSGIHKFTLEFPNESTLITIDNIIQSPLYRKNVLLPLSTSVGISTEVIYVNSGITSITTSDILKIENEYLKIKSIGITSSNSIEVERGFLGSIDISHPGIQTAYVYRGNYIINDDIIYFTSPPFGPNGLPGIEISSKFNGRLFSRSFNSERPNDKNLILDDISDQFVGLSSFTLKENGQNVVGLYTNTNSETLSELNNNPLILINNVPQVSNVNFEIINSNSNKINFLGESPKIGKILKISANKGFGYQPLIAAGATVSVSASGTISQVYLNGYGSGYRTPPNIEIISEVGYGASITATIGTSGTITSLNIVNSGVGYTSTNIPEIVIDEPIPYYGLNLIYDSTSNGIGTDAKVSLIIDNDSSVKNIEILDSGYNYKVGDVLNVVGIVTNSTVGPSFDKLKITIEEVASDVFSGFYPGQFIQFEDISNQFDSIKTDFNLITLIDGKRSGIVFKNNNNINIENNLLVFINDILQVPFDSYRYLNGVISFSEPPKEESNCNILYYQGSLYDIETIVPNETIKFGDVIRMEDSELTTLEYEQDNRVVKRIIGASELDTFAYDGPGIISNVVRPISWTKQKNDRIINGSLVSKSRNNQSSKIYPTANLIWNFNSNDTSLYVDNAYPLFIELDNSTGQVTEDKRNVKIIQNSTFNSSVFNVNVSASSSISSINVVNSGGGYDSNATISIISPQIKDPVYEFKYTSGINTTFSLNSITQGDIIVSVGNSNLVAISTNLINWSLDNFSYSPIIDFKKVQKSESNSYVSVGSSGKIFIKNSKNSPWVLCGIKTEIYEGPFLQNVVDSNYTGTFNDVIYNENLDIWVSIGNSGKIYYGNGATPNTFVEGFSQNYDYKSIAYNSSIMVSVGIGGISYSDNGKTWVNSGQTGNYYHVLYDNEKFIATTDNSIKISTNNGSNWTTVSIDISETFKKLLKYNETYIGLTTNNYVYTSYNLKNWIKINNVPSTSEINDVYNIEILTNKYPTFVGSSGSIFYSRPDIHKAILEPTITNGQLTNISVVDGGYGYFNVDSSSILIKSPSSKTEILKSIKAVGDYGKIVGIKTSNTGIGTNSPSISFELLTDYSESGYESLNTFGIQYSSLSVGDFFIIENSNVGTLTGYALTGITTHLGGMSNYPTSRVGTAISFLDGVYRVDFVQPTSINQGIVTVTCHFVPVNGGVAINTSGVSTNYYGNYSWSKIFDFQDRVDSSNLSYTVNSNSGLTGLSTSPLLQRMPSLLF